MAYTKTNWVNGTTPVDATNMNKIEDELETLDNNLPDGTGNVGKVLMHINTGNSWENYTPVDINYKNTSGSSIGSLKFVKCTEAEYTALSSKDSNTFYIIVG